MGNEGLNQFDESLRPKLRHEQPAIASHYDTGDGTNYRLEDLIELELKEFQRGLEEMGFTIGTDDVGMVESLAAEYDIYARYGEGDGDDFVGVVVMQLPYDGEYTKEMDPRLIITLTCPSEHPRYPSFLDAYNKAVTYAQEFKL